MSKDQQIQDLSYENIKFRQHIEAQDEKIRKLETDKLSLLSLLRLAEKSLEKIMETNDQPITKPERESRATALLALQQLRS